MLHEDDTARDLSLEDESQAAAKSKTRTQPTSAWRASDLPRARTPGCPRDGSYTGRAQLSKFERRGWRSHAALGAQALAQPLAIESASGRITLSIALSCELRTPVHVHTRWQEAPSIDAGRDARLLSQPGPPRHPGVTVARAGWVWGEANESICNRGARTVACICPN
jgi:hypothetical protein